MSDVDDLVATAQRQLDEHKAWLRSEIGKISVCGPEGPEEPWRRLMEQAGEIKLRVVRAQGSLVSVVYDYPDELYAFLSSEDAPEHLRASVAGGHVVNPNQPSTSVQKVPTEDVP